MSRLQSKLPILLSVASAALMAVVTASKLASWRGELAWVGALTIGLYLVWLVVETRVAAGEIGKGGTRLDRGTLELYALGRILTVGAGLVLHQTFEIGALAAWAGVVLFVTGVGLRLASIRELGRFYSHRVRLTAGQTVVETGPYRYIRHPAYTGMLLAHVGFVVLFFHWLSLAALVLVFLPSVVLRLRIEEHALARSMAGYAEYCRGRRRLIPRIW